MVRLVAAHQVVRHGVAEFVNGMACTNEIESVWSILKRGWVGVYHHFSAKHLQLCVNEFCFRLNEGDCRTHLDQRIGMRCAFSAHRKHMSYEELKGRAGSAYLMAG